MLRLSDDLLRSVADCLDLRDVSHMACTSSILASAVSLSLACNVNKDKDNNDSKHNSNNNSNAVCVYLARRRDLQILDCCRLHTAWLVNLFALMPGLQSVRLQGKQITEQVLEMLCRNAPALRHLSWGCYRDISAKKLLSELQQCPRL